MHITPYNQLSTRLSIQPPFLYFVPFRSKVLVVARIPFRLSVVLVRSSTCKSPIILYVVSYLLTSSRTCIDDTCSLVVVQLFVLDSRRSAHVVQARSTRRQNSRYIQTTYNFRDKSFSVQKPLVFLPCPHGPSQGAPDEVIVASSSSERERASPSITKASSPKESAPSFWGFIYQEFYYRNSPKALLVCGLTTFLLYQAGLFEIQYWLVCLLLRLPICRHRATQATGSMISFISPLTYHGFRPTWTL